MRATVRIRLVAGTRLPKRIRDRSESVHVKSEVVQGRRVRVLTMNGGAAYFWLGNAVVVRLPGSRRPFPFCALRAEQVLEIQTIRPAPHFTITIHNYHLCTECYANTSTVVSHKPAAIAGRQEFTLKCTACGHERTQVV